jgi:hemerythrin superfamily protein
MAARKKSATRKQASAGKKTAARKKTASRRSASTRTPDAIALLRADHQTVQDLFDKYEKTRGEDRKGALAEQICKELTVHAQIEEEIFYPAAREAIREEDLIDEATVEHQSAKDLIAQIEGSSPGEDMFDAKVTVLGEYIRHHVKEEQNEIFPQVKKTKLDLKALGEQLQARKMELMEGGGSSGGGGSRGAKRGSRGTKAGGGANSSGQGEGEREGEGEGLVARMARGIGFSS